MNYLRISLLVLVALMMGSATRLATSADASQGQSSALERGFRTGYSDGYNAGTRDTVDSAARDYRTKEDYQRADRSYNQSWGTMKITATAISRDLKRVMPPATTVVLSTQPYPPA